MDDYERTSAYVERVFDTLKDVKNSVDELLLEVPADCGSHIVTQHVKALELVTANAIFEVEESL